MLNAYTKKKKNQTQKMQPVYMLFFQQIITIS